MVWRPSPHPQLHHHARDGELACVSSSLVALTLELVCLVVARNTHCFIDDASTKNVYAIYIYIYYEGYREG
jgi:hypothetical protein